MTVLAAKAVEAAKVTAEQAEQAAAEAEGLPVGTPAERANKARARDRAQGLKKVTGRNAAAGGGHATGGSPGGH